MKRAIERMTALLLLSAFLLAFAGCGGKEPAEALATEPVITTEQADSTEHAISTERASVTESAADGTPAPSESARFYRLQGGCFFSADYRCFLETDQAVYTTAHKDIKTDEGWVKANYVLFSDKEYMDWMPLCGKPECMHDSLDCNAFFEDPGTARMWLYGEHFYYFTGTESLGMPKLMRMKLDGSEHEVMYKGGGVAVYPPEATSVGGSGGSVEFHDKYAFVTFNFHYSYTGLDQDLHKERRIFMFDLDDPSEPHELVFTDESGDTENRFCVSAGDGDTVYSVEQNSDYDEQTDVLINHNSSVYKYDIAAQTRVKLCDLPIISQQCRGWLYNGKLYCVGADEHEQDHMVYPEQGRPYVENFPGQRLMIVTVDVETGEIEIVNTAAREEAPWFCVFNGYVLGTVHETSVCELELGTYIYDLSGNFICRIPPVEGTPNVIVEYIVDDFFFGVQGVVSFMVDKNDEKIFDHNETHGPGWYFAADMIGKEDIAWQRWGE